jgi:ATP-dependent DNA helicase RecQ
MEGDCVTYFSYKDIAKLEKLLRDKTVAERERNIQLINESVAYIESAECRRKFILHYFGEEYNKDACNCMCDNCRHPKEKVDATADTKLALEVVKAVKEKHDLPYVVKIIMGKKVKELTDFKYEKLALFGKGANKEEHYWNSVIRNAMMVGLLNKDIEQYGILQLTKTSADFIKKPTPINIAINHNFEDDGTDVVVEDGGGSRAVLDPQLLEMLKDLRRSVGKAHSLPPYVIFQDVSLEEMASKYPIAVHELTEITGVSKGKVDRYGKEFLKLIADYVEENEIDRPTDFVLKSVANKGTDKIKIIQAIDKRISIDEIAKTLGMKRGELINEIESIVNSGTKVNIDYYLNSIIDEELIEYIFEYFKNSETESLDAAADEFKDDDIEIEDLQLARIKFMSEMAN